MITSAAGTKIEKIIIGDLKIGILDQNIWAQLEEKGAKIVRATDPLHNIGAALEQKSVPTLATLVRLCLGMLSSGTSVCVTATLMATDNGVLSEEEEVVAVAGSWIGYSTRCTGSQFSKSLEGRSYADKRDHLQTSKSRLQLAN